MAKAKFRVLREHEGDKFYRAGDERVANRSDVKHLVPNVLEEIGDADDEEATEETASTDNTETETEAAPAPRSRRGR